MFPPFPQEKAAIVLEKLIHAIESGDVRIEQVARSSEERKNQGIMLGALVCLDENGAEVNLVANSGNAKKLKIEKEKLKPKLSAPIGGETAQNAETAFQFVDSIVPAQEIENALAENDAKIHELTELIRSAKSAIHNDGTKSDHSELRRLREEREKLCARSLEKVHALYNFHCIDGKIRSLKEICDYYNRRKLPPTGTGDCCAPKLLDYAFAHDLQPLSLAETPYLAPSVSDCSLAEGVPLAVWSDSGKAKSATAVPRSDSEVAAGTPCNSAFGTSGTSGILHYELIPPCDERCGILLPAMLGLRILWRDDEICVVNKQSGVLSVPGRGEDKKDCIESRFRRLFGSRVEIAQPAAHRLDMETSGVMILAFTRAAHRELNRQFEAKEIEKEYVALLDGVLPQKGIAAQGEMELFFRLDVENRPHQIWDAENGKRAVTEWQILGVERYHAKDGTTRNVTRVLFKPRTGRTHQLRLASSDSHGFDTPIIGDTLYGKCEAGERLMLHAMKVTFTHPATGERMTVECPPEF